MSCGILYSNSVKNISDISVYGLDSSPVVTELEGLVTDTLQQSCVIDVSQLADHIIYIDINNVPEFNGLALLDIRGLSGFIKIKYFSDNNLGGVLLYETNYLPFDEMIATLNNYNSAFEKLNLVPESIPLHFFHSVERDYIVDTTSLADFPVGAPGVSVLNKNSAEGSLSMELVLKNSPYSDGISLSIPSFSIGKIYAGRGCFPETGFDPFSARFDSVFLGNTESSASGAIYGSAYPSLRRYELNFPLLLPSEIFSLRGLDAGLLNLSNNKPLVLRISENSDIPIIYGTVTTPFSFSQAAKEKFTATIGITEAR